MLWTQNAWSLGPGTDATAGVPITSAAYRCPQGHMLDSATTRQCPECGIHDTEMLEHEAGRGKYACLHCAHQFSVPDTP